MAIVFVSILIFVVTLGAALLGLYAHKRLPDEQKSDSARNIVGQVSGLVSLLPGPGPGHARRRELRLLQHAEGRA